MNEYDPAIIYVMMLKRPHQFEMGSKMEAVASLRPKFNEILNDAAARQNCHILSVRSCNHLDQYDHWGNLSHKEKLAYWCDDGLPLCPKMINKRNKKSKERIPAWNNQTQPFVRDPGFYTSQY